ncbi:hypothetical protein RB601_002035 [Gaeumannomyces tritici]
MPDYDKSRELSIEILDEPHLETLKRAISNIISTQAAETVYAQVVDGLPLREALRGPRASDLPIKHPIRTCHSDLCLGVLEKVHEFRDAFQPEILKFDSSIAVILFNLDTSLHKEDGVIEWVPPKDDWRYWDKHLNGPLPTLMYHLWYVDFEQYPEGAADMVGFWAENQILGGVALFDRRPETEGGEPGAVYWHPSRVGVTYRICKLRPDQTQKLLDFLLATEPQETTPLPILPGMENLSRVDPEEHIMETGIFRHSWERKKLPPPNATDLRLRDVHNLVDFPTAEDKAAASSRAYEAKYRGDLAEALGLEGEDLEREILRRDNL